MVLLFMLACLSSSEKGGDLDNSFWETHTEEETDSAIETDSATDDDLVSDLCDDAYLLELDFSRVNSASIWRFDLETNHATEVGSLSCDLQESNDYFMAMSADSKGHLWLLSRQGWLFKVMPSNLYCQPTGFNVLQTGFQPEGLAFMREDPQSTDLLYISGRDVSTEQGRLAVHHNDQLTIVGDIPGVSGTGNNIIDLAGSASGDLYGLRPSGSQTALFEVDSQTAERGEEWMLDVPAPMGWSFVLLFDNFWTFTSTDQSTTQVHWFEPATESLIPLTTLSFQTVGAALPPCAPDSSGS